MRPALALLLATGLAGCFPQPVPTETRPPVQEMVGRTRLMHDPGCTGVRIGQGIVLTAKHCLPEGAEDGGDYDGLFIAYVDDTHDFMVLTGDKPRMETLRLPDAQIGEHVYVVGYPQSIDDLEQHLTVTDGIYTGVEYESMQRITAHGYYGNSGGGVWNDAGELVGILVEIRPSGRTEAGYPIPFPAHSYMVPTRYIRSVLAKH